MVIRRAQMRDMPEINELLRQVLTVHHNGRPDLFKGDAKKYTDEELADLLGDDSRPVFVADEGGHVSGYAFCVLKQRKNDNILTDVKSLYIDDLCVEEKRRGQHIGSSLYEYALAYAREQGCYNVTLNVYECNAAAKQFYEKCGLVPQKTGMEAIL